MFKERGRVEGGSRKESVRERRGEADSDGEGERESESESESVTLQHSSAGRIPLCGSPLPTLQS